jgi:hypothetical protein
MQPKSAFPQLQPGEKAAMEISLPDQSFVQETERIANLIFIPHENVRMDSKEIPNLLNFSKHGSDSGGLKIRSKSKRGRVIGNHRRSLGNPE